MTFIGQSSYFVLISMSAETHIMHPTTCLDDIETEPNLMLSAFFQTHWYSKVTADIKWSRLPVRKDWLKSIGTITTRLKIGDLFTTVLFKVAENSSINALLETAFIDEQNLAVSPD